MLVRSFLKWYRNAPVEGRIEAVTAMAEAYLAGQLGGDSADEAEAALTLVLDDASAAVRRVLSRVFALAPNAPRHIVVALAHDVSAVSGLVLARSPHLGEADLIDCARRGDRLAHLAIAMRAGLTLSVSLVLADVADPEVLVALVRNADAALSDEAFARMIARHPTDGALRHALGERGDLPAHLRQSLVTALSADLLGLVTAAGWLDTGRAERIVGDSADMATITLAVEAADLGAFADHLIASRQMTPTLLLRSLLCGETALFGAALTSLTGFSPARVAGILKGRGGAPLSALCDKAGLPRWMIPAYAAGLAALTPAERGQARPAPVLDRTVIGAVLAAVLTENAPESRPLIALLRRFDAEAAREAARALAETLDTELPEMVEADEGMMIDLDALAAELVLPEDDAAEAALGLACEPMDVLPAEPAAAAEPVEASLPVVVEAEPEPDAAPLRRIVHRLVLPLPEAPIDRAPARLRDDSYRDELDALFTQAFGADQAAGPVPSQGSLRIIERTEDGLDEAFFANWMLRREAA